MNRLTPFPHLASRRRLARLGLFVLVGMIVGMRLAAAYSCATCTYIEGRELALGATQLFQSDRAAHEHQHQRENAGLMYWACVAMFDDQAFVLPESPRLDVIIAEYPAIPLIEVSYLGRARIAALGRAPPAFLS